MLVLGFFIGIRHAFEPDHVAAVASLASRTTTLRQALRHGAVWGLGHTLTLFMICGAALSLQKNLPVDIAHMLEVIVGIMLVLLGLDVVRRLVRERIHFHAHVHSGGDSHFHAHSHRGESLKSHNPRKHEHTHPARFPYRSLFVGLMHGMAGSAALIVLTVQSADSFWLGMAYVALFGVGSIVGMAVFSAVISVPLRSAKAVTWAHNTLQGAIGGGTVVLGVMTIIG